MTVKSIGRRLVLAVAMAGFALTAAAQRIDGQIYSQVYGLENTAANQQWDFYQGLSLRVRPEGSSGMAFKTHFLVTRRGDPADWAERVYNAYLDFRKPGSRVAVRAGRQFMYRGVITGSMDALSVEAFPTADLNVQLIGGLMTPYDKSLDLRSWDDGGVLGAYAQYRVTPQARAAVSYVNQRRSGQTAWHQVGANFNGAYNKSLYYLAQVEYNIEASDYQAARARLTYLVTDWTLTGEFVSQKPRVYEDSFFNIFELEAFNQIRAGASRRLGAYEAGLQVVHTFFAEGESGDELFGTFSAGIGTVGVVYKTGYGGDDFGVFGDVEVDLIENLSARLRSSYYSYTRRSVSFNEDATAFAGGLKYAPVPSVVLQAEVQESMNSAFDDDLRVLLRASYRLGR
jgi:hypothetical protein